MRITRLSRCFGLLALAGVACTDKSDTPGEGLIAWSDGSGEMGQSGTDGAGSFACGSIGETAVAFEEVTSQGTAAALRAAFERTLAGQHATPLRWTPRFGGTTTVEFQIVQWGAQALLRKFVAPCQDALSVPVTLRMASADGLIDESIEGTINVHQFSGAMKINGADQSVFVRQLPQRLKASSLQVGSCGVVIEYSESAFLSSFSGELSATADVDEQLTRDLYELATFDRTWPANTAIRVPVVRPALFDDACRTAVTAEFNRPADDAGFAPLVGRWVLCEGESTGLAAHDGLEIAADGSWKHLQEENGQLSELLGFDHEGQANVLGGSTLQLLGVALPQIEYSADRKGLRLTQGGPTSFNLTYAKANLPVQPARPKYMMGERAGSAACGDGEAYVHRFSSSEDLRSQLVGAWHFCSGAFRPDASRIAFALDGSYLHQDSDGRTVGRGRYEISDQSTVNGKGAFQINLMDSDLPADAPRYYAIGMPAMSRAPIKLHSSGYDGHPPTVLSALP
jgi:hypothetical protein